jgi:hypothetical protein
MGARAAQKDWTHGIWIQPGGVLVCVGTPTYVAKVSDTVWAHNVWRRGDP